LHSSILFADDRPDTFRIWDNYSAFGGGHYQFLYARNESEIYSMLLAQQVDFFICRLPLSNDNTNAFFESLVHTNPDLIRIALLKKHDREMLLRFLPYFHHFFDEAVEPDTLKHYLDRTNKIRHILGFETIIKICTWINALPSLPEAFYQVMDEISHPDPSIARISNLIEHDSSITAHITQTINSPAIGLPHRVSSMEQAVTLLGLEMTRAIVIHAGVNSYLHLPAFILATAESINHNSFGIGHLAYGITLLETGSPAMAQQAKIAGILNNIGYLLLLNNPRTQSEIQTILTANRMTLLEAEELLTGITHAEMGAYYLGLRGFDDALLEAVAHYYRPETRPTEGFTILTALHAAHALAPSPLRSIIPCKKTELCLPYLEKLGLQGKISAWQSLAREIFS